MKSLQENMIEYHNQLGKGMIQQAYKGLMEYMLGLKAHFASQIPNFQFPQIFITAPWT